MNKLIVFDGCDGVGKTSCALELCKEIDAIYYKTPPKVFESIRAVIESVPNYDLRFYYYLSSVLYASEEIKKILENKHVVCDRYIYSTIVYHRILGVNIDPEVENLVLRPDYGFCLYARDEVVKKRLSERAVFGKFDNNFELQKKAFTEFQTFNLSLFETSDFKVEESVKNIIKQLEL
jgi:thymidylate kinase